MSPADHADDAEECSKLHYFADKRQLPHSADNAVHVYVTKLWGEHARSFLVTSLVLPLHVNGLFSRRSRWWRRGNAASCIISQTKDSYHTVETMLFMFIQQSCEGTRLLFPCSFFAISLFFPRSFLARSLLVPYVSLFFPYVLNGRSRVSRGNKIQKLRKFRASEYRAKLAWTMLSAAEILYKKKRPLLLTYFRKVGTKPHLKVHGKQYKKVS